MKRYRINGQSIISSLDRNVCQFLLKGLADQGLLDCAPEEMHSVVLNHGGVEVTAHVSSGEVSFIPTIGLVG